MKTIGVILDNDYTIDVRVINEVRFLKGQGFDIHVICPNFEAKPLVENIDGINIHRFNMSKSLKDKLFGIMNVLPIYELLWIKKVREFVKQVSPDYLHAHDLFMAKIAYKGGCGKIPVVLDLHENFPAAILSYKWSSKFPHKLLSLPKLWKHKESKYLNYASKIVVLSNTFKQYLAKKYANINPDNVYVYPNVPDVKQLLSFPINENILNKKNKFTLFYFGGISERRGIYTSFEAIKILSKKFSNIHLLLIGPVDGHEKKIFDKFLNDDTIKDFVTYHPWKDISEFPSFTLASDVCLSPIEKNEQHESGVANKIFQYMLFEKPLIVSNCLPQKEIVEQHHCGLSFESGDAIDLAEKISFFINNPEEGRIMGKNGRKAVLEKFNLEVCGRELLKLYQSIG